MNRVDNKGLALLPLILSVLIIGALMGAGVGFVKQRVERAKYDESAAIIDSAVRSIVSWSADKGVLPLWGDNIPDSVMDEFCEVVKRPDDAYGRDLMYIYDSDLTAVNTGGVCGRTSTEISSSTDSDIAFAVVSSGQNGTVDSSPAVSGSYSGVVAFPSIDIFRIVTLEQLKNIAGCFSITQGRLKILNTDLPDACAGQAYEATLFAEGGVLAGTSPFYSWSISPSPAWITSLSPANQHLTMQGIPTAIGADTLDATVTDADGNTFIKNFTIDVVSCGSGPTPISEWGFDEGAGPTTADGAGPNDGSLTGGAAWTSDTPDNTGFALSFDGSGDYVRVPDDVSLHLTDELTLSAWVKETTSRTYAKIVSRRSGNYFYFLGVDNGRPYGGIGDGSIYEVTGKSLIMSLDTWNHLAFAYSNTADIMYMHFAGTERPSNVSQNLPPNAGIDISIGGDFEGTSNFFAGIIDDVAIYDAVLSSSDIRALYANHAHPDLMASYYFEGDASDASGNGHDGVIHGASFVADRYGNTDCALNFDGSDYVLIDDHVDLRFNQTLTITAWVNAAGHSSYAKIVSRRSGSNFYFLGVDNGRPYGGIGNGSNYTVTRKSIDMPLNQWHFIAFVFDSQANSMHIYYDGLLDEQAVAVDLPVVPGVDLTIGADFEGNSNFFEGLIDSVAIYDQALTADEIRSRYE